MKKKAVVIGLMSMLIGGSLAYGAEEAPKPAPAPSPLQNVLAGANVDVYLGLFPFVEAAHVTGASAAPAAADRPTLMGALSYTDDDKPWRGRGTVSTSHLGFRGSIPITGDWKAIWQIESGVPVDGDASPSTLASRNSNVGVAGPIGTMFFGNWDTPYKWSSLQTAPLRFPTPGDYGNIIGNPGFGVPVTVTQSTKGGGAPKSDASFDRRQGNSLQYWSPNIQGFSARLAYSLDEGRNGSTAAFASAPKVMAGSLSYDSKMVTVRYAYERHEDYFGLSQIGGSAPSVTNDSSTDDGHKLAVIVNLGDTKISGIAERIAYRNDDTAAGKVDEYSRNAFYLYVMQKFGDGRAWASLGVADEGDCSVVGGGTCSTDGLGATQLSAGYAYTFNKNVEFFGLVYDLDNKESGSYSTGFSSAPGAKTIGAGVGMSMAF